MIDVQTYDSIHDAWAHHPGLDAPGVLQVVLQPGAAPGGTSWPEDIVGGIRRALGDDEAGVTVYITPAGRVYLGTTDRPAGSCVAAVVDMRQPPLDLVAAGDIAHLAGVESVTVYRWIERHPAFPQPASRTSAGAVWHRADIIDWLDETGRHITG